MNNKRKFDLKGFLLETAIILTSMFLLMIFIFESRLITTLNELNSNDMFDLATPKIITWSLVMVFTFTYIYYLQKKSAIE